MVGLANCPAASSRSERSALRLPAAVISIAGKSSDTAALVCVSWYEQCGLDDDEREMAPCSSRSVSQSVGWWQSREKFIEELVPISVRSITDSARPR